MAIQLAFDSTYGILRGHVKGRFDMDEFRKVHDEIASGENYPTTTPAIWDLRELDFRDFDTQVANQVESVRSEFNSRRTAKIVFVVPNQLGYGMVRMLQVILGITDDSMIYYEYDQAEKWLLNVIQTSPTQDHS